MIPPTKAYGKPARAGQYFVLCQSEGAYVLASRQRWNRKQDAKTFADQCCSSRHAVVVRVSREGT